MKTAIICFTAQGCRKALEIKEILALSGDEAEVWCKKKTLEFNCGKPVRLLEESLEQWTEEVFASCDALIFVGATGIAVRSIAPFLQGKTKDPAVLAVDEQGTYVIPLVSGHIGGANELCAEIARKLGAIPVITTATDINRKFAADVFARKNGLWISDMKKAKMVSAELLEGKTVRLHSDFPVEGRMPEELRWAEDAERWILPEELRKIETAEDAVRMGDTDAEKSVNAVSEYAISITMDEKDEEEINFAADKECCKTVPSELYTRTLYLVPKWAVLGLGCRRGKTMEELETFVGKVLKDNKISIHAVKKVCSIDVKAGEQGILDFCRKYGLKFETYSAEELMQAQGNFSASGFVERSVGVDNVCERSAVLGSGSGKLLVRKTAENGMTAAVALEDRRICFE